MAILFDLDGTLVDSAEDIINTINHLCDKLKKPIVDPKLLRDNTSFGLEKLLNIALSNKDGIIDVADLEVLKNQFRHVYKQSNFINSKPFTGIKELITNLRQNQFKVGVATNKTLELAKPILEKLNLFSEIDCLITADMVINPKPAPDSVLLALKTLGAKAEDSLFIGDAKQDIIAGNTAGVKTVAALFGYVGDRILARSWPANYFVNQATDIWPLICYLYNCSSK